MSIFVFLFVIFLILPILTYLTYFKKREVREYDVGIVEVCIETIAGEKYVKIFSGNVDNHIINSAQVYYNYWKLNIGTVISVKSIDDGNDILIPVHLIKKMEASHKAHIIRA